jgi:hypothetical protein
VPVLDRLRNAARELALLLAVQVRRALQRMPRTADGLEAAPRAIGAQHVAGAELGVEGAIG